MKIGDLVRHKNNKEIYIVVRTGTYQACLLDHRGYRWIGKDFLEVINENR